MNWDQIEGQWQQIKGTRNRGVDAWITKFDRPNGETKTSEGKDKDAS